MEDQNSNNSSHGSSSSTTEPVRSRWTPKPEQILILESIFNSGMVNPPKDETVRIRKMLEKFGAVGDANVFYWFQNRRSRSRRRQRQLQAAGLAGEHKPLWSNNTLQQPQAVPGGVIHHYNKNHGGDFGIANSDASSCFLTSNASFLFGPSSSSSCSSSSGGGDNGMENLFPLSRQMGFQDIDQHSSDVASILCPSDQGSNFHYQAGFITVFINGVATEVPSGAIDMRAMFGEEVVLVHSSGVPLPTSGFGLLQHGEAYFLVPRSS